MAARSSHDLTRRYGKVDGHRIEYQWIGENPEGVPMVFLHEGLGSIELWRDFPAAVVAATGSAGLVYSRYGNGWSDPLSEPRRPDYMHVEALEVLPALIDRLVGSPPLLVGHSDGASIAVIYAGSGYPVEGLVLLAPHVFVEDCSVAAIEAIRGDFLATDLAEKMAKYHRDPAATFWGWNDIWLS
ncbi:MAG: alpha/beta hydrolase, partial [Actinomycetota bacterium]|nr:alpha/beta hydrolase [Actinomycetota bacterium]